MKHVKIDFLDNNSQITRRFSKSLEFKKYDKTKPAKIQFKLNEVVKVLELDKNFNKNKISKTNCKFISKIDSNKFFLSFVDNDGFENNNCTFKFSGFKILSGNTKLITKSKTTLIFDATNDSKIKLIGNVNNEIIEKEFLIKNNKTPKTTEIKCKLTVSKAVKNNYFNIKITDLNGSFHKKCSFHNYVYKVLSGDAIAVNYNSNLYSSTKRFLATQQSIINFNSSYENKSIIINPTITLGNSYNYSNNILSKYKKFKPTPLKHQKSIFSYPIYKIKILEF